jgi:cation transport regulator
VEKKSAASKGRRLNRKPQVKNPEEIARRKRTGQKVIYSHDTDLPDKVKNNLPKHAQDIYREAFNHAWEQYKSPAKRRGGRKQPREQVAHKVAWAAVEKKYQKDEKGNWVEG